MALALPGRAREVTMEITVDDLNKHTSMNTLLVKLDDLFLKEKMDLTYEAYLNFEWITRDCDVAMTDYKIDFEQRYSYMLKWNSLMQCWYLNC